MNTLITGCSGLIGSALIEHLFKVGHSIQCLKRNTSVDRDSFWATHFLPGENTRSFDAIIHLAGENVAQGRWTRARKKRILDSRLNGTKELIDYLAVLPQKPKVLLCASAVGFYGDRGDEVVDESSSGGHGFLAEVCQQWEKETQRLRTLGIRVVNLRFGMVLSPHGGALDKMKPAFQRGVGGVIGSGRQYMSWISIRDLVKIVEHIINRDTIHGPVNVVSPIPATNREFTRSLATVVHRPALLRVPSLAAKIVFGQMATEMLLASTRVTPRVLLESGYTFVDQSLDAVLSYCCGSKNGTQEHGT